MKTTEQLQELLSVAERASKGKWRWNINPKTKHVTLESENGPRQIVIDFVRWGMNSAQPRFNVEGLMQDAQDCAAIVSGREHHAAWFQTLDHPDANHIATFDPTTCAELVREVMQLQEQIDKSLTCVVCSASLCESETPPHCEDCILTEEHYES